MYSRHNGCIIGIPALLCGALQISALLPSTAAAQPSLASRPKAQPDLTTVFLAERLAKVLGDESEICQKTASLPGSTG
jgi:hypothetical protein